MKTKFIFFFLPIILLLLYCNSINKFPNDKEKIKNLINNYSTSFDLKNFEEFISFCTDDFKFFTLDGQVFDRNSIGNFLKRVMARWSNLKTKIEELDIHVGKRLAFASYKQKLSYVSGSKNGVMHNLITVTFIKINSTWEMAHFHMTTKY